MMISRGRGIHQQLDDGPRRCGEGKAESRYRRDGLRAVGNQCCDVCLAGTEAGRLRSALVPSTSQNDWLRAE